MIMLPDIAHFSFILAFSIALVQIMVPLLGIWKKHTACIQVAFFAAFAQCFFVALSFFLLMFLFVTNDFSVAYIAINASADMPLLYRLCAVWGAHAGSLLLWIFVLTLWSALVAFFYRNKPHNSVARVLIVMSAITVCFDVFLLCYSDPLIRASSALTHDHTLNPILQDPGLLFHPPLLYLGYVGLSVVFAFALVALLMGRHTAITPSQLRPWVTSSWCFLTIGIVLGSWWSYRELGWGGFWFWDPVENASLLPWLVATALIHTLMSDDKNNQLSSTSLFLSLCAFSLSLLGTFLVRSGVLISVHTFSIDPARGLFLLRLCLIVSGIAFFIYAIRARQWMQTRIIDPVSREGFVLINTILFLCAMLSILLGTLYPIVLNVIGLQKISVGAPYFNIVLLPVLMLTLFFMGLSVLAIFLKTADALFMTTAKLLLLATVIASCVLLYVDYFFPWALFVLLVLAVWVIGCVIFYLWCSNTRNIGMLMSHAGLAVVTIGLVVCVVGGRERQVIMRAGDSEWIANTQFFLQKMSKIQAKNFLAIQATVFVEQNHQMIAILYPQLREFQKAHIVLPKAGIHAGVLNDYYVALGNPLSHHRWILQLDIKPLVRWIWGGGVMMMIGGLLSLRRKIPWNTR